MYDKILKNGLIIDPSQNINKIGSIAIQEGRIAAVGDDFLDTANAKEVFNLDGNIIAPGLIDIHCHPAPKFADIGVPADEIGINTGVTLLCDAGTAGEANFEAIRSFIIGHSKTDILCMLNISNVGLIELPEIWCKRNINIDRSIKVIEDNRDIIRGVKVRAVESLADGLGIEGIEMAKRVATEVKLPLMMHIGTTRKRLLNDKLDDFSRAAVSLLEEGDILSHYLTWEPGGMILRDGTIYKELREAKERGIILDSSHGLNHFSFSNARIAIDNGIIPNVISTDLCTVVLPSAISLTVVMSKFIALGLNVNQVIEMVTINPARALRENNRHGSLQKGSVADITVMELKKGNYIYNDGTNGETINAETLLEPRMVFKAGDMMPAFSRYRISPKFNRVQ